MANQITTPIREGLRETPLGAIDDNRQRPLGLQSRFKPPTTGSVQAPASQQPNVAPEEKKKRKNFKPSSLCLTPPALIQGARGQSYQRGSCIGEGGFARCFQVNDDNGELYAAKTLAKAALKSEKTRNKLLTEIKVHRAMDHPNIVKFIDCFEDNQNVYMLLEICSNQSLSDMISHRKHISELEARFFLLQILGAVSYMHSRGIVHRDLKLGNIFLDKDMNLKIGDFGLAARLDTHSSRRYTICGTPNYISPEVLMRPHSHHFPADIWSTGIILYAMLVGRPPFQDRDVDNIYARIKKHQKSFPPAPSTSMDAAWSQVSEPARDLISWMLHPDPSQRPTVYQCLQHRWIQNETFISSVPVAALEREVFISVSLEESARNRAAVMDKVGLTSRRIGVARGESVEPVSDSEMKFTSRTHVLPASISPPSTRDKYKPVTVDAHSPAASQSETHRLPLYDSPVVGRMNVDRMVQPSLNESPVVSRLRSEGQYNIDSMPGSVAAPSGYRERFKHIAVRTSTTTSTAAKFGEFAPFQENPYGQQKQPLASVPSSEMNLSRPPSSKTWNVMLQLRQSLRQTLASIRRNLEVVQSNEGMPSFVDPVEPPLIITRWADFKETYGLAYCFNDGSVGLLYRDHTSMRMDPKFDTYMYYESRSTPGCTTVHRTAKNTSDPKRSKKIDVITYCHRYMDRELAHAIQPVRKGGDVSYGQVLHHLSKGPDYAMFVLTDGTLQFNFQDHNKVIVYDNGTKVSVVTDHHQLFSWKIEDALRSTKATHFQRVGLKNKLATIHNAAIAYYRSLD